jgi:membrane protein DedA with SNARE-associated domain
VGWLLAFTLLLCAWVGGAAWDSASKYHEMGIQTACLVAVLAILAAVAATLGRPGTPRGAP